MDPGPGSGGVEVVDLPSVSVEALVDLGHTVALMVWQLATTNIHCQTERVCAFSRRQQALVVWQLALTGTHYLTQSLLSL